MEIDIEIDILDQQDKFPVTPALEHLLGEIVRWCWHIEGRTGSPEVSIVLCDDEFIRVLNRDYRQIDQPTDVLSFPQEEPYADDLAELSPILDDEVLLGDVVISLERAMEQAEAYDHSFEREVGYLLAHGLLHLLGMDHNTEEERQLMRDKEEQILAQVQLTR